MKIFFTALLFSILYYSQAQEVSGTVMDIETNQILPHCHILIRYSGAMFASDDEGNFSILAKEDDEIIFAYLGYQSDTLRIQKGKSHYEILLTPIHSQLDEVVVTAMARSGLIKENPISISNVTLKMIEQTNENNIMDALAKKAAGLNMLKTGPNISKPFIRGMGFNRVLTLYDEVRQEGQQWGGEHGLEVDNYNIERAEVIKGPASLVYGSDALAGVVSLLPFVPRETDGKIHGRLLSEFQTNNGLSGNGLRISQGNIHWLWALRGSYRIAKNYSNSVDGRVYNTAFRETNLSALLGYKTAKGFTHLNFSLYDNLQGIPDGSRDSLTGKFTKQIYEGANDDLKNRPIVAESELNSYSLSPLHQRIQHYRVYLKNHHEIGRGDLQTLVAYSQNIRREFIHPSAPDQPGTYHRLNTVNYSARYNAPEFSGIEISIGTNGMFQRNREDQAASNFAIPNYDLLDFGLYALTKWKIKKWTVIGGVRHDSRTIQTSTMYVGSNPFTGFDTQVYPPDTVGSITQFKTSTYSFHGFTLSLGSTYQVNDHVNLKFNFSRGYRAPSISEITSNGLDAGAHIIYLGNPNFQSEFSWQEDIGLFTNYQEINASISLFNKNIQNYIYLDQVTDSQGKPLEDAQGNRTIQYQQSSAQLYGLEASLSFKPKALHGFSVNNQLALCYGFNRNPVFRNKKQQGEYLPLIPPARLVSSLNQEIQFKSKLLSEVNFSLEADYSAAQNRFLALYGTETKTNGYTLFNAGIGATIYKKWQFQFQVNNILNEEYQSNMSRLKYFEYYSQRPNGRSGIYGMGRNFCVKLIVNF